MTRWRALALVAALLVVSVFSAVPRTHSQRVTVGGPHNEADATAPIGVDTTSTTTIRQSKGAVASGALSAADQAACAAGRNGGATAPGVTADSIKLGATVVETGIGRTFLADVRYAMAAVVNDVNRAGGICGRRLSLSLKDDGWDPNLGFTFLQNLVEGEKVFALAVVPSSEGLRAAGNWLNDRNVPVVGTDGMLVNQYTTPVIWPVAASTITAVHVMAKQAADRGLHNFAMVYDANYRFGVEGAYAFNAAVKRLTGSDIPGYSNPLSGSQRCAGRFCGIKAGDPSYGPALQQFNSACRQPPACDFVVYLLEPDTAQKWMAGGGLQSGEVNIAGPQPLFNRAFGVGCGSKCHGMWVWTGYKPPIEPFTNDPAVTGFVNALAQTNGQADPNNSFVEGGYVGMRLLVEALKQVGPRLTRAALIEALDNMHIDSGLSRPLAWTAKNHFANQCLMGFSIQAKPSFAGWRQETDWVCDPWVGQDTPPGS